MRVVLVAVVSLDGCLTRHDDGGVAWASEDDKSHFSSTLATCDSSIVGSATYLAARDHMLANLHARRRRMVMTRTPDCYADDSRPGLLEFISESPAALIDRLRADGSSRCALLGGGQIYSAFLADGLVDEMIITIEPKIFGTGTRLAGDTIPIDPSFRLDEVSRLGDSTILARYLRR